MPDSFVGEEYKKLFVSEVTSYLQELNKLVVDLEKNPDRRDVIDAIFRIFHTIKSMAGTMGLEDMSKECHRIEDLLFPIRNGEKKASSAVIDEILKGIDVIENYVSGKMTAGRSRILIHLKRDTPLPGARFFSIVKNLKEKMEIELIQPTLDEILNGTEVFDFVVEVEKINTFQKYIKEFSEVESIEPIVEERKEIVEPEEQRKPRQLRVDIEDLDTLQNILAEIVITKERLSSLIKDVGDPTLLSAMEFHSRSITDLQNIIMKIRMVPLSLIFDRFPRYVRDLAKKIGKKINLIITGSDIELDRSLIESISDPLHHIVRNAVDHGIELPEDRKKLGKNEEGNIEISATREKGFIRITIKDDGSGVDLNDIKKMAIKKGLATEDELRKMSEREILSFLFLPGFSTREEISDISGRGVGLDVVRDAMRKIGGNIEIHTAAGLGTTITLYVPLTMAIIKAYIIRVGTELYAIPMTFLIETTQLNTDKVSYIHGKPVVLLRNEVMSVYNLREILRITKNETRNTELPTLIINVEGKRFILLTDELVSSGEIVVKHLPYILRKIQQFTGVTILGDGYPCLILDVPNLIK